MGHTQIYMSTLSIDTRQDKILSTNVLLHSSIDYVYVSCHPRTYIKYLRCCLSNESRIPSLSWCWTFYSFVFMDAYSILTSYDNSNC